MPLHELAPGLWYADDTLHLPGGVRMPIRMTVVRLGDGSLLLHSPVALSPELEAALAALGPVGHIVAPSRLHHLHMPAAQARYPDAQAWGAPGLAEKQPALRLHAALGADAPASWADDLEQVLLAGAPGLSEVVFLHRASQTLIVSDLIFNVQQGSLATQLALRTTGTWRRTTMSRVWWLYCRDRALLGESLGRVLAWSPRRVVMAHGEILADPDGTRLPAALWLR